MAIVKMSKFTLFTFESQKEELLSKLQNFEKVQFIDLREKREDDLSFSKRVKKNLPTMN